MGHNVHNTGDAVASGGGYPNTGLNVHPEVASLAAEAGQYSWGPDQKAKLRDAEIQRLVTWLQANTKIDAREDNAIGAAINLLETARLMVQHLTPAVLEILKSAISALQSAGVDIKDFKS